jgi:hypothetical protein
MFCPQLPEVGSLLSPFSVQELRAQGSCAPQVPCPAPFSRRSHCPVLGTQPSTVQA